MTLKNSAGYMIYTGKNSVSYQHTKRGKRSSKNMKNVHEGKPARGRRRIGFSINIGGFARQSLVPLSSTYIVPQVDQHTIAPLHMVGFKSGNESPHEGPELPGTEGSRRGFCINKQWLFFVVGHRAAEAEGQQVGVYLLVGIVTILRSC
jgi:hypothetical protein